MRCHDTLEAPHSPEYVPRDYVPVFVPEFEHLEDLVPAEDEAPASLLPPGFLSPRIRPLSPRALRAEMNVIASSLYHLLHPSGRPPLLPIPLSIPSTSHRAGIPEADTPPRNRPLLATPRPGCEVGESFAAAARQQDPLWLMKSIAVIESSEFCTRHHDAQKDRAAMRAEIEVLRSERLAYEQEGIQTHEALARSKAYCKELKARVAVLETHAHRLEWQRNSGGGDESHSSHAENPRNMHSEHPCYYADFMKCHPLNFKGTEGAVGLTRWIEKMESVFNISGCDVENQVKFATCTLLDATLTWWNSQIRTLGPDAYTMTWSVLNKKMTDKYCPLGEVKKLEIELWNLKVRDNNIPAYTNRFQDLALICTKFVSNETKKVDKYISRLPDNIYGNVKSSKPKTLDETIELANELMDQKLRTYAERKSDSKRKADDTSRNNQQPFRSRMSRKHTTWDLLRKRPMREMRPRHYARDCRSTGNTNATNNRGRNGPNPKGNGCFECRNHGHFKRDFPKLKNKDEGNRNAQGWVYAVGNAERNGNAAGNPDSNVITGTFLLNNRYASILFDTGADRSFVSTAFSSLIYIIPTPLDNQYDVELANEKIVGINTIIQGCTLNFLNHPFTIDLMPVELGSFDAIIGMDWLRRHHAVIVCDEKLVRVPFGNETLVFCGAESYIRRESRLTVISCSKV
nr:hypothetical protein [Tanacetum cinerariifolium]